MLITRGLGRLGIILIRGFGAYKVVANSINSNDVVLEVVHFRSKIEPTKRYKVEL